MKRLAKRLLALLLLLVVLALAAVVAAVIVILRQLPDASVPRLPGLSAPVPVDFDARAVPTIHASSLLDAFRAQGYLVARERMFQLELQRRAASGTLSEIFGEAALPVDRLHRLYGFRQVAEAAVPLLPEDQRTQLEAYAAGVNAFVTSHPHRCGIELEVLGLAPRAWTAADSLMVLLLMYEDLSTSWKDEALAESLAALPPAQRHFLMPTVTDEDVLLIPDASPRPPADAPALFAQAHASLAPSSLAPDLLELPGLPSWAGERARDVGSNNWVVAPSRSKSGKALLANDPHLELMAPGFWYEVRIELPSHWVQGVALAGIPGISIGQTERLAWGFTNLGTDVQDLYREKAIGERVETIAVKGGAPVEMRVPFGKHGPQVRTGDSLAWVALDPKNIRLPLAGLMTAVDWKTFNDGVDAYYGPAQNIVYADADGHIGWRASGLVPIRRDGDDGLHVHDGDDPEEDWRGFVPMSELPRVLDPPSGYLVTANQRVVGTSFPRMITSDWAAPNRARRIAARIEEAGKLDRDGMESIELDVVSPFHKEMMRLLAASVPSLARFATWGGAADAGSAMFLEARMWEHALHAALNARLLGAKSEDFEWPNDETTLLAMLRADDAAWARAGLGDRGTLLGDAEARAAALLAKSPARTWGERNALHIEHPFGGASALLAWLFDPPSFPQSGGADTVRAASRAFGQSMRFIVDWGDPEATTLVIPLGQSGHLWSPHREDQMEWWRRGDPGGVHTRLKQVSAGEGMVFAP